MSQLCCRSSQILNRSEMWRAGTLVALLVVLATVLAGVIFQMVRGSHTDKQLEHFGSQITDAMVVVLGTASQALVVDADLSLAGQVRVVAAPNPLSFSVFEINVPLRVITASSDRVRLVDASELVARAHFAADNFTLHAVADDLTSMVMLDNKPGVAVYAMSAASHEQVLGIQNISQAGTFDMSKLVDNQRFAIKMCGVRVSLDPAVHVHSVMQSPAFITPEILKSRALAGITLILSSGSPSCTAMFRRYKEEDGYILARADVSDNGVTVRYACFKRGVPPRFVSTAEKALDWNSKGQYEESVSATPAIQGGIAQTETMSAEEIYASAVTLSSVYIPISTAKRVCLVEVTPKCVRVTTKPGDRLMEARMVQVPTMMSEPSSTFQADAAKPLQMLVRGGAAIACPVGDHIHLFQNIADYNPSSNAPFAAEGQAIKCKEHGDKVFRYTNGELRHYPNPRVAASWDKNWSKFKKKDCTGIAVGDKMGENK